MFVSRQEVSAAQVQSESASPVNRPAHSDTPLGSPNSPGKLVKQLDETGPHSARIIDYVSGMMCP